MQSSCRNAKNNIGESACNKSGFLEQRRFLGCSRQNLEKNSQHLARGGSKPAYRKTVALSHHTAHTGQVLPPSKSLGIE
jgi:hypothetical protein